jgi:hypothetical protein
MKGRTVRLIPLFLSAFSLYAFRYGDLLGNSYPITPFYYLFVLTLLIVALNLIIRHPGWNLFFGSILATVLISFAVIYWIGFSAFDQINNERFYLIGLIALVIASVSALVSVVADGIRYQRHIKEGTHESKE